MNQQQFEIREHSLAELISEIDKVITKPYTESKIGVGEIATMDDEGCLSTIVFNPNNDTAVLAAYNHFKGQGLTAKEPIPAATKYIYLFKDSWDKNVESVF